MTITSDLDTLSYLLHSPRLTDMEADKLLQVMRQLAWADKEIDEKETQKTIAESDRDNRRRRMDIAMVILDDTKITDLDAIAEIIWPNPLTSHEFAEGVQQHDISAPTCVPGEGECPLGGKHQWKLVTGAGQDNCACGAWRDAPLGVHHFLDDGVTPRCKASYNRNQCIYTEGHSEDPHMDHASFEW